MSYTYLPLFGVDNYNPLDVSVATPYGGGAFETEDNLLVTLWGVTQDEYGVPTAGNLIKPYVFTEAGAADVAGATAAGISNAEKVYGQFFNSRYAARFYLAFEGDDSAPETLLGVLKPPGDMKNQLAQALTPPVSASAPLGFRTQARGSLLSSYLWYFGATDVEYGQLSEEATFGGPSLGGVGSSGLNLLRTNGADGVFPQFYNASAQPREVISALITGDYYVPVVFTRTEASVHIFDIAYRGSNARR